jgi:hypothetical protein
MGVIHPGPHSVAHPLHGPQIPLDHLLKEHRNSQRGMEWDFDVQLPERQWQGVLIIFYAKATI